MKIWILSSEVGVSAIDSPAKVFTDEDEAYSAFEKEVESACGKYFVRLTEGELTLPPVYEAGPDLLAALCEADSYLQGWYDDDMQEGMGELQEIVESAMAKAKGEVPRPWALQAAASDLLAACRDALEVECDMSGFPDSELANTLKAAIAKAEGK